jgi:1,4-dihydroxy-2-naphthoyl-CoA hydrolase
MKETLNLRGKNTLVEHIGIQLTSIGDDFLEGTMPVDERTVQPVRILHGGASCVLAESLASIAANYVVDPAKHYCVGLEINANHIRSVRDGFVAGRASPVHLGRTTQVWDIRIEHEGKLVCVSRLTLAVLNR